MERRLMTRAEVAQLLGVSEKTLQHWRERGDIGPRSFRAGKAVRYRAEEVDRWITEQEMADTGGSAA